MESALPRIRLGQDDGRLALLVDGVVQSVAVAAGDAPDGYWTAMLPDARPAAALLLGLGAGTLAHLLTHRFGPVPIVGVEREPAVVELARSTFGLDLPNLEVVVEDAFAYVARCPASFDLICVDLYDGYELVRGTTGKPFLRRVRELLEPGGVAVFNLPFSHRLPQQLRRLREVFRIVRAVDVDLNVVVHGRAP